MFPKALLEQLPTLGQAATVLAALVALTALFLQARSTARERVREAATELRRKLLSFSHSMEMWNDVLDNTFLMFVAASRAVKELEGRALRGNADGATEGTDPSITVAVSLGWNEAPGPARLDAADNDLRLSSHRLTGRLALLHEATRMLTKIRWEHYSQLTVSKVVALWTGLQSEPDMGNELEDFLVDNLATLDAALRPTRHGIRVFIKEAVDQTTSLSDHELVRLSQGPTQFTSTYFEAMREVARQLNAVTSLSDDMHRDLAAKLAKVEEELREAGVVPGRSAEVGRPQ